MHSATIKFRPCPRDELAEKHLLREVRLHAVLRYEIISQLWSMDYVFKVIAHLHSTAPVQKQSKFKCGFEVILRVTFSWQWGATQKFQLLSFTAADMIAVNITPASFQVTFHGQHFSTV